jgi:nucleoside-diphosphate-sugar epimerase
MQTILGSGGAIGKDLAKYLSEERIPVRLVARNPQDAAADNELLPLDLTAEGNVDRAIAGSDVVYVTIGFPYFYKKWQALWPPFIKRVIDACEKHGSKLVFFDNIYMYDPSYLGNMDENTPFGPISKKGRVRLQLVQMIEEAVEKGRIQALIARSADFYGPEIEKNSMMTELILNNLSRGKKANWLGPLHLRHSFTYTPDAAVATGMLGNTSEAFDQTWHLPTTANPPTAQEWIEMAADLLAAKPRSQILTPFMAGLMGVFVPVMKEIKEMMYQYDRDYVFVSDKFEKAFDFVPTAYKTGLKAIVQSDFDS